MDVLSDVLTSIHLRRRARFHRRLSAPWGMAVKASRSAEFRVMVRGGCWLRIPGRGEPIALQGGDVVAFLHGKADRLTDAPGREARPAEEILEGQNVAHYGPVTYG